MTKPNHFQAAKRMAEIEPFHVMEMMRRAAELEAQGENILHLEVGEPDFATAEPIIAAGIAALQAAETHYTLARGRIQLRQEISNWYQQRYHASVEPERIQVTVGASGALQMVCWSLINPGDEVLLVDPGYPCNQNFVRLAGGTPVLLPTRADNGWKCTPEQINKAITNKTRALLIASPNNPTGTVMTRAEITAIADLCESQQIALIVDEIYGGLIYDQPDFSACELGSEIFVINSFSKYFGMTGWRLGWVVSPERFVRPLEKLAQNLVISPPTIAQFAAEAAFEPATIAILEQRRLQFQQRRNYLLETLPDLGFKIESSPGGAFYLFAEITSLQRSSKELCRHILEQAGVALTPGLDFSRVHADNHVRLAYTIGLTDLKAAVERIKAVV